MKERWRLLQEIVNHKNIKVYSLCCCCCWDGRWNGAADRAVSFVGVNWWWSDGSGDERDRLLPVGDIINCDDDDVARLSRDGGGISGSTRLWFGRYATLFSTSLNTSKKYQFIYRHKKQNERTALLVHILLVVFVVDVAVLPPNWLLFLIR